MYYVVDGHEAATCEGLCNTIRRAQNVNWTRVVLDVVPYTEKGNPSKKYKPFRVQVFNYPHFTDVWVHGEDSCAYKCAVMLKGYMELDGIAVVFKGDEPIYNFMGMGKLPR